MMSLSQALRLERHRVTAFTGAGGKTSAMFLSARERSPAIATTSTHIGDWQAGLAGCHYIWRADEPMPGVEQHLGGGVTLVTGEHHPAQGRFGGLNTAQLEKLRQLAGYHDIPVFIEADGARRMALKAPAEHEPAVPGFVDLVVVLAGLSALGSPLDERAVFRPEIFAELSGLKMGESISPSAVVNMLAHRQGGQKNIPQPARRAVILNQADTPALQSIAGQMAENLLQDFDAVLVAGLKNAATPVLAVYEKIAAVIFAENPPLGLGRPESVVGGAGTPFVRVIAEKAIAAGLGPVLVVAGRAAADVQSALDGLPVKMIFNAEWQKGRESFIRAGVGALPADCGAAFVLLESQPHIGVDLLHAMKEHHRIYMPAVLAPYVFDQRSYPFLFDRITFPDLLKTVDGSGFRGIFSKFSPRYLNWYDRRLPVFVGTQADFEKLGNEG